MRCQWKVFFSIGLICGIYLMISLLSSDDINEKKNSIHFMDHVSEKYDSDIGNRSNYLTALLLTHNRPKRLLRALQNLNNAKHLKEILIVWDNPTDVDLKILDEKKWNIPVTVLVKNTDKLTNRFDAFDRVTTDGVYMQDDDVILNLKSLELAHQVWLHNKERLVGLAPKSHDYDTKKEKFIYSYNPSCNYSMAVTPAVLFHKMWLKRYFTDIPAEIISKIDSWMNCEDIALNFLVANHTRLPPIIIKPHLRARDTICLGKDCEGKRLSGRKSHAIQRNECLNYFAKMYSGMPLIYTSSEYVQNKNSHRIIKCSKRK